MGESYVEREGEEIFGRGGDLGIEEGGRGVRTNEWKVTGEGGGWARVVKG